MAPRRKRKATNNGTDQHDGSDAEAPAAAAAIDGTGGQMPGGQHLAAAAVENEGRAEHNEQLPLDDGQQIVAAAAVENDGTNGQAGNKVLWRALANQRISSSVSRSTVSRTASPALSSSSASSNASRRQRKNHSKIGRVPINVNADCPNVPPGVLPNPKTRQYQVKSVLAQFTHASGRKCYFLEWLGFRGRNSWCLSEDTDCTEYIEMFGTGATVEAVLSALLGESVPASIADELQANPKFGQVLAKMDDVEEEFELRTTQYNILFAKGLMESAEGKGIIEDAKSKLRRFVAKCMN